MSKKSVFDHLTEQLDGVVKGRRYIIAEIGKLKESVMDLEEKLAQSSGGGASIGSLVNDLKNFMQQTISTLGQLKNSFTSLNSAVQSISQQLQKLQATGIRAAAPQPAQAAPAPAPAPTPAPTPTPSPTPSPAPTMTSPPPQPAPQAAPAPSSSGAPSAGIASALDRVLSVAKSGTPCAQVGQMLDALRTSISKADPLNPILFELSMEAGKLKSLGDKPLDGPNLQSLETKITKWKSKV